MDETSTRGRLTYGGYTPRSHFRKHKDIKIKDIEN